MAVDLLNLPSLRTTELRDDPKKGYIVSAVTTLPTESCPHCGSSTFHGHGSKVQVFIDIPLHNKPTTLEVLRKRFRCQDCGRTFIEEVPDLHPTRQATNRFVEYVAVLGQRLPMAEAARQAGIDNKTVSAIIDDYWTEHDKMLIPVTPRVMGLDEVHIGRIYRAVITNLETNYGTLCRRPHCHTFRLEEPVDLAEVEVTFFEQADPRRR